MIIHVSYWPYEAGANKRTSVISVDDVPRHGDIVELNDVRFYVKEIVWKQVGDRENHTPHLELQRL